jgi:hypothetical protein
MFFHVLVFSCDTIFFLHDIWRWKAFHATYWVPSLATLFYNIALILSMQLLMNKSHSVI